MNPVRPTLNRRRAVQVAPPPAATPKSTCGTGVCSQSRSVRNDGSPTAQASPARIAASTPSRCLRSATDLGSS